MSGLLFVEDLGGSYLGLRVQKLVSVLRGQGSAIALISIGVLTDLESIFLDRIRMLYQRVYHALVFKLLIKLRILQTSVYTRALVRSLKSRFHRTKPDLVLKIFGSAAHLINLLIIRKVLSWLVQENGIIGLRVLESD